LSRFGPLVILREAKVAPAPLPTLSAIVYAAPLEHVAVTLLDASTFELIGFGMLEPKLSAAAAMLQVGTTVPLTAKLVVAVAAHACALPSSTHSAAVRNIVCILMVVPPEDLPLKPASRSAPGR
jgi:hypothetical protein